MPDSNLQKIKDIRVAYRKTFSTEDGAKVLADLERRCFITDTTFNKDPYLFSFQEGTRSVVLHIKQLIEVADELQKEAVSG